MSLRSSILEGSPLQNFLVSMGLGVVPVAGPFLSAAYNAARVGNRFSNYLSQRNAVNNPPYTGPNDLFGVGAPGQTPVAAAAPGQTSSTWFTPAAGQSNAYSALLNNAAPAAPTYSSPSESVWNAGYLMGGNQMSNLAANNYANIIRNKQR